MVFSAVFNLHDGAGVVSVFTTLQRWPNQTNTRRRSVFAGL